MDGEQIGSVEARRWLLKDDPPRLRIVGALLGGSVPGVVGVAAWWLGVPYVAVIAGLGVPIGAVLGALAAVRVTRPGWVPVVLAVAAGAPLSVAVVMVAGGGLDDPLASLLAFVFIALFAEILGLPVTLPTAILAALGLRWLGRREPLTALAMAGTLAVVVTLAGLGTLLASGQLEAVAGSPGFLSFIWAP